MSQVWDGQWLADQLGIRLDSIEGVDVTEWVGLALRRNPKRAQLLVSHFLGKHIPADPRTVYGLSLKLGSSVRAVLRNESALVIGFAETATALGAAVSDELDVDYLHTTRRHVGELEPFGDFLEEHSHATSHLLFPDDSMLFDPDRALILVDDELSTGRTAMNMIQALHRIAPRQHYVIGCFLDMRGLVDIASMHAFADTLGIQLQAVRMAGGTVHLPADVVARADALIAAQPDPAPPAPPRAKVRLVESLWPAGVRDGARHGFRYEDRRQASIAARAVAARLAELIEGDRVLVLGSEELMHAPILIAISLADWADEGRVVHVSSTTRSPVLAIDEPGYSIRTALTFPAHDDPADGPGLRYAYNVAPETGGEPYSDIVLVIDDVADTPALYAPGGLLEQLAGVCERLLVQVLPSFRPTA